MMFILEQRYLFDASLARTTEHLLHHRDPSHDLALKSTYAPGFQSLNFLTPVAPASGPVSSASAPHEVLFVDPRVADWQSLVAGTPSNVQIVVIDPNKDGLDQVTQALAGQNNVTALQFLTYGAPGQIELGNSMVTDATIAAKAGEIASWGDHLAPNADILFWGCNVGEGSAGATFISDMHTLTGAQVGASTAPIGSAALGGDWTLNATTGALDIGSPFTTKAMDSYSGVLDAPLPQVAFTNVPTDVLLGNSFTETVTFQNGAAAAAGYGPFIDLFVPHDAAQSATLTSATYLGSAVTVDAVTLSTTIPGHVGVLGALHPLALDSSGNPLFVQAPAGYQAGDTLYVLQLPFGSYTVGEPAAAVTLNFTTDGATELSASHGGQTLNITAIGGFQYGADPLNDPTTDPSIRGTAVTPSATSNADGTVASTTPVNLIDVSATTDLHEGETATGPDYPFHYVVTLTPAAVTSSDAISNFSMDFTLPGSVELVSNGTITLTGANGTTSFTAAATVQGGVVHIDIPSLSGGPVTISIPVFVPKDNASGNPILDPVTGAPVTISLQPIYSYSGTWNPLPQSLDHVSSGPLPTFSGDSSTDPISTNFVAKSLAIQLTNDASGATVPGQVITETEHFQVSDYFNLQSLVIQQQVSDGLTLLAPGDAGYSAPVLSVTEGGVTLASSTSFDSVGALTPVFNTVNGQTVAESGGSNFWSFSRDDSGVTANPGSTTVNFMIGALLANAAPGALASVLEGGEGAGATQGTVTFKVKALDMYTNSFAGQSLRENDTVGGTIISSGTSASVVTVSGSMATATGGVVSDSSSDSESVPVNATALTIVDVNGVAPTGLPINPGDTVTYALTYNLQTGDYGNLQLATYLPLPLFDASHPNADSTTVANFTAGSSVTPGVGQYFLVGPSGSAISSATVDATANGLTFGLGTRDDPTNTPSQVTIYFTVRATNKPFADGLALTALGTSADTDAHAAVLAQAAIHQIDINEPELVTKTGIVSIIGDPPGSPTKGAFQADPTNSAYTLANTTNTNPSSGGSAPFNPAGTAGDPLTGSGNPLTAANLNATGADAGDTVRVVTTVENAGHAAAFDVTVNGALPTGYSASDVTNFGLYDSNGNPIAFTKPDGSAATAADYFSGGGIKASGSVAPNSAIYVSYDLTLASTQEAGKTLTASGTTINWSNIAGGVAAGEGFVSGGTPLGETAAAISDNATVMTTSPSVAKTIISADDTTSSVPVALNSVVLGETVQYQVVVTLPEGTLTNNGNAVAVTDLLPAGMSLVSLDSVTFSNGVNQSGAVTPTGALSGSNLTVDLGTLVDNTNKDTAGTVTITYTAKVNDTNTPTSGQTYTNNAALTYDGAPIPAGQQTVTEVDPAVAETITVSSGANTVYSNENLTYTVTLTNNGTAPANNVLDYLQISGGLTYVPGSLTYVSGGSGPSVDDTSVATTGLKAALASLGVGQTATFTFQATVDPNLPAGTTLIVNTPNGSGSYTSLPSGIDGGGHVYSNTASNPVFNQDFSPTLSIVGESNNTNGGGASFAPISSANVAVGDIVRLHAYVEIPEGQNPASLDFALPSGLTYAGGATIALVSPNGDLTSDQAALAMATQYQDSNAASPDYVSPSINAGLAGDVATFAPTDTLPAGQIDAISTPNHVIVNLGTVTNNDSSSTPNYVLVEFNAIVANTSANTDGASLSGSVTVNSQTSNSVTATIVEPHLTLTKTVSAIAGGTITYSETITNTGDATAYNVSLNDPESSNVGAISGLASSGGGQGLTIVSGNGTNDLQATLTLAAHQSETLTYSVAVTNPAAAVPDSTATVTYTSLSNTSETLDGTSSGASGSVTGSRDASSYPASPNSYEATATLGLGTVSGQVWNDVGANLGTFQGVGTYDTPLSGVGVMGSFTGTSGLVTEAVATAADGTYTLLVPNGAVSINVPTAGSGGLAANETLVLDNNGLVPPSSSTVNVVASSGAPVTGINYVYQTPDTAPVIGNWGGQPAVTVTGQGAPTVLSSLGATVVDTELTQLGGDYGGTVLTVERYNSSGTAATPNAADSFTGSGTLSLSGGSVTLGGTVIGAYTESGGVLTVTFGSGTSAAQIGQLLDRLAYSNASPGTLIPGVEIGATLSDGNSSGIQGTGGVMTSNVALAAVNVIPPPVVDTFTEPNDAPAAGSAVAVDAGLTLGAPAGAAYESATLQITGNLASAEDVLALTANPATMGNISASYDAATGTLTLTSAGNTATPAQWTAALDAVSYYDTSARPQTTDRSVTLTTTDTANTVVTAPLATIHVIPTNNSPILDTSIPVSLAPGGNDAQPPSGAVGTLVSSLIGNASAGASPGNVTDPDGAGAANGGAIIPTGLAVTGADTSKGNWYYSIDGGATWVEFAGTGIATPISDSNALHLLPTARLYFQATSTDFGGAIPAALTFRAWDQFDGAANGSLGSLTSPGFGALGAGANTSGSAYSSAADVVPLTVTPPPPVVDTFTEPNDAPAAGSAVAVDAGLTLGAPAGAAYKSATLQITGNLASAEDVLALTANPATMGNISASYDAATGTLTLTSAGNTATPAQWTAALDAVSYYDTSARPQTTDRSVTLTTTDTANTVVTAPLATIHVIPTNNSPILDTSIPVSLAPGGNDAQPPSGAVGTLVSSLIGNASAGASPGNVTDPDGAGAANGGAIIPTGLAVTGADTSKGNWYYSIDGGATWVEFAGTGIATPISDSNALHLLPTARLYFQATSTDFGGAIPAALTFRAWDQFDGAANGSLGSLTSPGFGALGTGANTSGSAYSSAADVIPLTVTPPPPVVDTFTEPNDAPAAGSAVAVDAGLTLGAPAGAAYKSATLQITGNLASAEDVLALTANPATMGNISASYDAATGTLTLTSAGNTATPAQWTAALDAVSYYDTSARPQTTDRSVTLTTTDTANTVVTAPLATIHVIPTNNSPILDTSIPVSLAPGGNDAQPPSGAVGTLVSSLIGNASAGASPGNVTDPDGAGAANGGAIIPTGLAVTGADTSKGNWYYSIDGGATWVEFAGTGIATPISDSNALHLLPTARLYFQATSTDFGGAIPAALTFRAWDQFDGAANGSLGSLTSPGFGALGAGANTSGSLIRQRPTSSP